MCVHKKGKMQNIVKRYLNKWVHKKENIKHIINHIRHLSRATLTPYRPILAVSNIDRSIFAGIVRSEKSMAKYV